MLVLMWMGCVEGGALQCSSEVVVVDEAVGRVEYVEMADEGCRLLEVPNTLRLLRVSSANTSREAVCDGDLELVYHVENLEPSDLNADLLDVVHPAEDVLVDERESLMEGDWILVFPSDGGVSPQTWIHHFQIGVSGSSFGDDVCEVGIRGW